MNATVASRKASFLFGIISETIIFHREEKRQLNPESRLVPERVRGENQGYISMDVIRMRDVHRSAPLFMNTKQ